VPAIPVDVAGSIETIARLALRSQQATQAKLGLTEMFTINGTTDVAHAFLFGGSAASLEEVPPGASRQRVERAFLKAASDRTCGGPGTSDDERWGAAVTPEPAAVLDLVDHVSGRLSIRAPAPA
jgi:hypothetical protein